MSSAPPVAHDFKADRKRVNKRALKKARSGRLPGTRAQPPVVVFEAKPGSPESTLPAVRIFLGSEPLQYKAERVFLFSVAKHRNPGRRYEVYLMKDLDGYDREKWATGFTKYRFAIPYMAGGTGRAIYNDVDQIYLGDPAELFDRDMEGAGLLAIDQKETSVMLMDCEKLAKLWEIDLGPDSQARLGSASAVHEAGLWGIMPGIWNARDGEYVAGESKVLHYTTLDTQPWKPFPDVYDYGPNENEHVWRELEAGANAARYLPWTRENPGPRFAELGASGQGASGQDHTAPIAALIEATGAKTVLYCGAGSGADWAGVTVTQGDPVSPGPEGPFDGVVLTDVLERVAEEDIPWMLEEAFRRAGKFVYVGVVRDSVLPPEWWRGQMELCSAMHQAVSWELHVPTQGDDSWLTKLTRSFTGTTERFSHKGASST